MIKNDTWIRELADRGGIAPFEPQQVRREGDRPVISYGLSSFGYDIRLSPNEFRIFRHIPGTVVDPKNFNPENLETTPLHSDESGDFFILPAHSYGLGVALERLEVPDNVTIVCLGKSTYARCFSGDTRVALVDGTAPTLEEMSNRAEAGELFWGYSVNQFGRIIVTQLEAPRYIDRDRLLGITLDNDREIRCTPDHQFLTRDGRMVPASELRPNDSLMPLYRQYQRGYEMVYQPLNGFQYPTHRLSDEWNLAQGIYEAAPNTHRHHIDHDRRNNNPWNIIRMNAQEHIKLHNDVNYGEDFDAIESHDTIQNNIAAFRGLAGTASSQHPNNHKVKSIRELPGTHDVYCLTVPETGNFALDAGVFVHNCGIIANITPAEAAWKGYLTLEFSNSSSADCRMYAREGVVQLLFFEGDPCSVSYQDRQGKYQNQSEEVTIARI